MSGVYPTTHAWIVSGSGEVKDLPSNNPILRYRLSHLESSIIFFELIKS